MVNMQPPVFCAFLLFLSREINGFPWKQDNPICTSHDKLCDISFDVKSNKGLGPNLQPMVNNIPMCQCPGSKSCPNGGQDRARVMYQEMTSPGMAITTKLSFCDEKSVPKRLCKAGEVAMTVRGFGPVLTQIVGGVKCQCRVPLVLKRAYPFGMLSERQYTCGQKTCQVNSSKRPVCERVHPARYGMDKVTEIPCGCPKQFYCDVSGIGLSKTNRPTEFHCEPMSNWKK